MTRQEAEQIIRGLSLPAAATRPGRESFQQRRKPMTNAEARSVCDQLEGLCDSRGMNRRVQGHNYRDAQVAWARRVYGMRGAK